MDATLHDLLYFTSDRELVWHKFRLRDLIDEVIRPLIPHLDDHDIRLQIDVSAQHLLWADREMIRIAVLDLVLNAIEVMPGGGELVITSCETHGGWELEVADSGPGLPLQLDDRIFEPFVTTKPSGTGLGLAVVAGVVKSHGGTVTAMNCPEGGAAFVVRIPHRDAREAAA